MVNGGVLSTLFQAHDSVLSYGVRALPGKVSLVKEEGYGIFRGRKEIRH